MSIQEEWEKVCEAFGGRGGSGWIRANCPFCEEKEGVHDDRQSMGLNTATGGYNCFRCHTTGMIPEDLRDEIPYMPPAPDAPKVEKPPVQIAEGYIPLYEPPGLGHHLLDPARDYLTRKGGDPPGRELPVSTLTETRMGAILFGYLANRIIMPIPDYAYEDPWAVPWRGWVSRDYTGKPANGKKYLYPKNMNREGLLYNEPALWVETDRPVFAVESMLDVYALWPDAVAFLGKPIESQIPALVNARRPVCVALDGDAWEEGWMLGLKIRFRGQRAGSLRFPARTDPGQRPREQLDQAALACLDTWDPVRVA